MAECYKNPRESAIYIQCMLQSLAFTNSHVYCEDCEERLSKNFPVNIHCRNWWTASTFLCERTAQCYHATQLLLIISAGACCCCTCSYRPPNTTSMIKATNLQLPLMLVISPVVYKLLSHNPAIIILTNRARPAINSAWYSWLTQSLYCIDRVHGASTKLSHGDTLTFQ